ncbi:unnamed protein product [marine sediment metagenome]|uniref:Uncharacterized protein n=1 Tax=marine sediment metagenome TaxID=412755 RepID=X1C122_9ZZZZ
MTNQNQNLSEQFDLLDCEKPQLLRLKESYSELGMMSKFYKWLSKKLTGGKND